MRVHFLLSIGTCFVLSISTMAKAQELNADETQALLIQGTWKIQTGGEYNYFLWNPDGTLCVKMYDPHAENCDDSGTWTKDGIKVCYKLQWWGKAEDIHDLCFNTVKTGPVNYEALDANGLTALLISIPNSD